MIDEDAVEWYRFACTWCDTRWSTRYNVRYVTDGAGRIWSLHLHDGVPCEAPAVAQTVCPGCHRGGVRVERLSHPADAGGSAPRAGRTT